MATRDGNTVVYRIKTVDNKEVVEPVAIKLGRKLGDLREITGQLQSGDKLVLDPSSRLKAGSTVSIGNS